MTKPTDLSSRAALSRKVAENAMQARKGQTTDIEAQLAELNSMVEGEIETYMTRDTPPPIYMTPAMGEVWTKVLQNAPEYHFKKTEEQSLAEFCWTTVALQRLMATDALLMEPEEMMRMTRLLSVSRVLTLRLRLGTEKNSLVAKQALATKMLKANELTDLINDTSTNPRAGLMFGEGSNEIQ
jgi:hypothetical protein